MFLAASWLGSFAYSYQIRSSSKASSLVLMPASVWWTLQTRQPTYSCCQ